MTASLPMYDTAATRAANDRFWQAIRSEYGRGPAALDRTQDPHETWNEAGLVFSQTCGLPYRSGLFRKVQLVGTPDYGVEGCAPGMYCSVLVVRENDERSTIEDFNAARLARNDHRSQSGWAAIRQHLRDRQAGFSFDMNILETGSHAASVRAVAEAKADIAAIDAVTWALLRRDTAETDRLRELERTSPTPGLPFITGLDETPEKLFGAVQRAICDLCDQDRACLMLNDIVKIAHQHYLAVPAP